jgi:acyl carrier protein
MDVVILEELTCVFRNVFDDPTLVISTDTNADDVVGWDSFSHVNLMIAVEHHFKIHFTDKEIVSFKNVGELITDISMKRGSSG